MLNAAELLDKTIESLLEAGEAGRSKWYGPMPDGSCCVLTRAAMVKGEERHNNNDPRTDLWETVSQNLYGQSISNLNWGPGEERQGGELSPKQFKLTLDELVDKLREIKRML